MGKLELLSLVGQIYETAHDAKRWTDVLREIEQRTGTVIALFLRFPSQGDAGDALAPSLDPALFESYRQRLFALDPIRPFLSSVPEGVPSRIREDPKRQLAGLEFHREWTDPQSLSRSSLFAVLDRSSNRAISVLRIFVRRGES